MTDPSFYITMATAGLAGLGMVTVAGLSGWRGWLAYKSQELATAREVSGGQAAAPNTGARIEIADLKERIRKLEAIAAGVDL